MELDESWALDGDRTLDIQDFIAGGQNDAFEYIRQDPLSSREAVSSASFKHKEQTYRFDASDEDLSLSVLAGKILPGLRTPLRFVHCGTVLNPETKAGNLSKAAVIQILEAPEEQAPSPELAERDPSILAGTQAEPETEHQELSELKEEGASSEVPGEAAEVGPTVRVERTEVAEDSRDMQQGFGLFLGFAEDDEVALARLCHHGVFLLESERSKISDDALIEREFWHLRANPHLIEQRSGLNSIGLDFKINPFENRDPIHLLLAFVFAFALPVVGTLLVHCFNADKLLQRPVKTVSILGMAASIVFTLFKGLWGFETAPLNFLLPLYLQ